MAHLTVNGVTFPGVADSFAESPEFIGDNLGRSQNGSLVESRTTRKRRWGVRSVFLSASDAEAWRLLLEGDGHFWRLGTNAISSKGLGPSSGGTYSFTTFSPPTGTTACVEVGAGSQISFPVAAYMGPRWTPTLGFTISIYKLDVSTSGDATTGFYRYMITGSSPWSVGTPNPAGITQWQDSTSGSFNVGQWVAMSAGGSLTIHGRGNVAGVAAFKQYAYLTVLPFALPASWQSSFVAFTEARRAAGLPWVSLNPKIVLGGDAIPDANGASVVARVNTLEQRNVVLSGAHRNNARVLEVEFIEV